MVDRFFSFRRAPPHQDVHSFITADRIPGGAEQFGWPPESISIHTGTMAVQAALLEASRTETSDHNQERLGFKDMLWRTRGSKRLVMVIQSYIPFL